MSRMLASLVGSARREAFAVYERSHAWLRDQQAPARAKARARAQVEAKLDALARRQPVAFDGNVLIDGSFDNPNYWFRFSLLRAALGLAQGRETGLVGEYARGRVRRTFAAFGIDRIEALPLQRATPSLARAAARLMARTKTADDILDWKLPGDVPAAIVYDTILKRQRLASVDIARADFGPLLIDSLAAIDYAQRLLDRTKFDLVVLSHPVTTLLGSLGWLALERGIATMLPFGALGTLRFARFEKPVDLFDFYDRPSGAAMAALPAAKADALADAGRAYMQGRLAGHASDLPSRYAFAKTTAKADRAAICAQFGWDPAKPIVGFYASNWYDWPHQLGMSHFRDFLDWTQETARVAAADASVNWLFKPHPCETWFGGISLRDVFAQFGAPAHVRLTDPAWSNADILGAIDALVTYHGTAGVEIATLGKPVLLPDRGKYDDCGFAKAARSRAEYLALIAGRWWEGIDPVQTKRNAEIFAGWWFCAPAWQRGFILGEDGDQATLYADMDRLLSDCAPQIDREIAEIGVWWRSGSKFYHTRKMVEADAYWLANADVGPNGA